MTHALRRGMAIVAAAACTLTAQASLAHAAGIAYDSYGGIQAATSPNGIPSMGDGAFTSSRTVANNTAKANPGLNPIDANDFGCQPAAGRNPVVLVPGTGEDAYATWAMQATLLKRDGWCVFTFNYNPTVTDAGTTDDYSSFTGDIRASAQFMGDFVDRVLAATGAQKVDVVGHSQGGGILPRTWIKFYGGATKVDKLVGIVPNNQGTTMLGLGEMVGGIDAISGSALSVSFTAHNQQGLLQQLQGSKLFTELNAGSMTVPGISYTVIATSVDTTVTPYTNTFIPEPGVKNLVLQNQCPTHLTAHGSMTFDAAVYQDVRNALDPANAKPVNCWVLPANV